MVSPAEGRQSRGRRERPSEVKPGEAREGTLKEKVGGHFGSSCCHSGGLQALGSLERDCGECSMIMKGTEEVAPGDDCDIE